jgi:hypothetical protein
MAERGLLIHHNNALAHTTFSVQQFLAAKRMAVMPHHSYSPQLPAIYSFQQKKKKTAATMTSFPPYP